MRSLFALIALSLLLLARPAFAARDRKEFLTDEEQDKLREAQDPSQRIEVYLALAQVRLDRFEEFRKKPADPRYDNGAYLDSLLDHYIALNEELKNWIDDQYERHGDMRRGLRALMQSGSRQLEELRRIQQSPDSYASAYKKTLQDAIDELSDTLDGSAKALAGQEKNLAQMKRDEKDEAHLSKGRRKEEEKRNKEEKKLRKRQRKRGVPADPDEN
jgi:septal ring factor EnvC (AmiA/AmiB activator)